MRLLLDTHIFLWYVSADPRLPAAFRDAIRDPANQVYLSVASVWEAVIKYGLGKLPLPSPPEEYLPRQRVAHQIACLDIGLHLIGELPERLARPVVDPVPHGPAIGEAAHSFLFMDHLGTGVSWRNSTQTLAMRPSAVNSAYTG